MNKIKEYKELIATIIGVFTCLWFIYSTRSIASEAAQKVNAMEKTMAMMAASIQVDSGKLEGFLVAMGIDPTKAHTWSAYPKEPQKDSSGIAPNYPWVEITSNLDIGVHYMVVIDSLGKPNLLVDTLWDFREK